MLNVRAPDDKIEEGMTAVAVEAKRARDFGFSASELERAKKNLDRRLRAGLRRARQVGELVVRPGAAQPVPRERTGAGHRVRVRAGQAAAAHDHDGRRRRDRCAALMNDDGKVVLVTAPQKDSVKPPAEPGHAHRADVGGSHVRSRAWSDTSTTRALVENKPQPAAIASRRELAEVGVTVVTFANGVEAWLKPTTFKNDQILFTLTAPGRRVACGVPGLRGGGARDELRADVRRRRPEGARSREAARGQDRERRAVHLAVEPRHLRQRRRRRISKPACSSSIRTSSRPATIRSSSTS